jgi:translocation and assembly module TamB
VQKLSSATGARAEIGGIELQFWPLVANLHNVVLQGTKDPEDAPVFKAKKITLRVGIHLLLHQRLTLDELLVDHPVVHIIIDHKGNVPPASGKSASNLRKLFDLGVGHVLISNAELRYQDQQVRLDAELYDLGTEIKGDPHAQRYTGSVSYRDARLQYLNHHRTLRHSVTARFNISPSHFGIDFLRGTVGSSTLSLRGDINDFDNPEFSADYDARIHTPDSEAELSSLSLAGDVLLSGKVHYRSSGRKSLFADMSVNGKLASEDLSARSPDAVLQLRRLDAQFQLVNGSLETHNATVELLGGQANFDFDAQHLDVSPVYHIAASLRRLSFNEIEQAIGVLKLRHVNLFSSVDGIAEATWTDSAGNLILRSDLLFNSPLNEIAEPSMNGFPVEGAIHLKYNRLRRVIVFRDTKLRVSSMAMAVQGEAGDYSNLHVRADVPDLHQLASVICTFVPGESRVKGIFGSAELNGTMQGGLRTPIFMGQVSAKNLRIHNTTWSNATIIGQVDQSEFVLKRALLVGVNQGKELLSGRIALHRWTYLPTNLITGKLSLQRLRVADLLDAADLHYPAFGEMSGDINFHGSEFNPAGSGRIKIFDGRFYDEPLQNATLEFHASNGSVDSTLKIDTAAGSATADLSYRPAAKTYELTLDAPSLALDALHAVRYRGLPLRGVARLSAESQGTLEDIRLSATLDIGRLEYAGTSISQLNAKIRVANKKAEVEARSQMTTGSVAARAYLNLTGDYDCDAAIDTDVLEIEHLLDRLPNVPRGIRIRTELHGTLRGPLLEKERLEGDLTIPILDGRYESLQVTSTGPIQLHYARSLFTLQSTEFRGSGISLRMQGRIPVAGIVNMNLSARGDVDAGLLRIIWPELRSSGAISFDIQTAGSTQTPLLRGQMQFREVALRTDAAPLRLDNLNGSVNIEHNRLQISNFTGKLGGGDLSLAGSIRYSPNPQFDVRMQAKSVRLRYPTGFRTLLDGDLALTGTFSASRLNGRVLIDEFSFTPEFDLAKVGEYFGRGAPPRPAGFGDSIGLAVAVQSQSQLSATSALASAEGDVNLRVIGTVANPVLIGRADLTSGEMFYRNRRYQFERGVVVCSDPNKTRPAVDISASTTVQQYDLALSVRGYLDKLNISYASDPPLPTADIINLLAVGKTTQQGYGMSGGTDSILASQAAGQVSTKMQSLTGISGLRIDPLVGGSNRDPSARIAIQQRVTKNFLFTFSTDVSQPGAETVEGKYQINRRWSVGVARDQVGGIAVDGRYHTKF